MDIPLLIICILGLCLALMAVGTPNASPSSRPRAGDIPFSSDGSPFISPDPDGHGPHTPGQIGTEAGSTTAMSTHDRSFRPMDRGDAT